MAHTVQFQCVKPLFISLGNSENRGFAFIQWEILHSNLESQGRFISCNDFPTMDNNAYQPVKLCVFQYAGQFRGLEE